MLNGIIGGVDIMQFKLYADMALIALLIAISVFDLKKRIVPDQLVIAIAALALIQLLLFGKWMDTLAGAAVCGGLMLLARVLGSRMAKTEALGWGDVKLMAASGAYLGLFRQGVALVLGTALGAMAALTLLALKKAGRKDEIPFGPALCAGVAIAALWGWDIIEWYVNLVFRN